ncbi:MAG: hypothetical protein ACXVBR_17915 [Flavisolibacter sp.]
MKWYKILPVFLFLLSLTTARAQTADEIIAKNLEATGGKETWKKIHSLVEEGVLNLNGTEINFDFLILHDKGYRQNISFAGMQGYSILPQPRAGIIIPGRGISKLRR